jgi:glyoxylase-like metal-dependent hydrolase (beta-lactamase superfamily II)
MIDKFICGPLFENCYVISEGSDCIIVDPGQGFLKASELIKQRYSVKAIFITHGHIDHVDGIKYFNSPIYISKEDKNILMDSYKSLYDFFELDYPFSNMNLDFKILDDEEEFELIGHKFKVLKTPGHTNGSLCFLMDNKYLFSGDTLFNRSCGRTDFPTGDSEAMQISLNRLVNQLDENIVVYPGHEDSTTILEEKHKNPYILK